MAQKLEFGREKSILLTPVGDDSVVIIGDTYPICEHIRGLGGRWNKDAREWRVDGSMASIVAILRIVVDKMNLDAADKRKESAKKAAETRRRKNRKWKPEEKEEMQASYDAWAANHTDGRVTNGAESQCPTCYRPYFLDFRGTEFRGCHHCASRCLSD